MSRDQGIDMVMQYDHVRPYDMDIFLKKAEMSEDELLALVEPMRDPAVWSRQNGAWIRQDHIGNHRGDAGVEEARLKQVQNWRPFEPTPSSAMARFQQDGKQTDYVIL
jgi:hypothetical protein